jgi:hypothetical protein
MRLYKLSTSTHPQLAGKTVAVSRVLVVQVGSDEESLLQLGNGYRRVWKRVPETVCDPEQNVPLLHL